MRKINWGSWKTTIGGIAGILTGLGMLGKIINQLMLDGTIHFEEIAVAVTAIGTGVTGLFARDNNVSSQDVGIR